MNRYYIRDYYLDLVKKIREEILDVIFLIDLIVGFFGEIEEDFEGIFDLVR